MRKVIKIISIVFILLWIAAIGMCIAGRITYTPPSNEEPLGVALSKGIYTIFIFISFLGALSAVAFSVAIHGFFADTKSFANKTALGLSILTNALLYTFIITMLFTNSDAILGLLAAWIISGLVCFISLMATWLTNRRK